MILRDLGGGGVPIVSPVCNWLTPPDGTLAQLPDTLGDASGTEYAACGWRDTSDPFSPGDDGCAYGYMDGVAAGECGPGC